MKNSAQATNAGLFGDIFGTGQGAGTFDFKGLLGDPMLQFGLSTLANNGDMSKGLQQALVASQLQSRNARDAKRDEREDQRFGWERSDREQTLAQRAAYNAALDANEMGLTAEQVSAARMMSNEQGARYIAQVTNQPSFETVQSPFGRGGVGQVNSLTGKIDGYQGPTTHKPPTTRNRLDGDQTIQEEFDSVSGQWMTVGQGARFAPNVTRDLVQPILEKVSRGEALTAAEQRTYDMATQLDPIKALMRNAMGGQTSGQAGASLVGAPSELPVGAKQIGTQNGVPVYETPDGRRFIEE